MSLRASSSGVIEEARPSSRQPRRQRSIFKIVYQSVGELADRAPVIDLSLHCGCRQVGRAGEGSPRPPERPLAGS
jgi:hypothetical protein